MNLNPLEAAKLAVKESDVLYSPTEYRAILANLAEYTESLLASQRELRDSQKTHTFTYSVPEIRNDQLDYSVYTKP